VEALSPCGISDFQYEDYAGWKTQDVVADALGRRGLPASPDHVLEISTLKSQLAGKFLEAHRPVDVDCGAVLAGLATHYPLGLASSGSRASVQRFLNWTGSRSLFRSVFTSQDVRKSKPDPEIYVRCAEQMGVAGPQCLVVEDAVAGVTAARSMGATVIGVAGTVSEQQLRQAGATHVIPRLGDLRELIDIPPVTSIPTDWTAVIPAAGRGSRLGFHRPKILYPVAGRMILEWMLDFLGPNYSRLIFVLSPDGAQEVTAELEKLVPGRFEVTIQEIPTGMGAAVELALPHVRTEHMTVVWGDQVTLQRDSVETCQQLHAGPLQPDLTCPTVLRDQPYIHFERNPEGYISSVRQAREGDSMPPQGESDTGFFCFRTASLKEMLPRVRRTAGEGTGEFNLLPVIPLMAQCGMVLTPRVMRLEETMGINSAEDTVAVTTFLRRAHGR